MNSKRTQTKQDKEIRVDEQILNVRKTHVEETQLSQDRQRWTPLNGSDKASNVKLGNKITKLIELKYHDLLLKDPGLTACSILDLEYAEMIIF